VFVPVPYFALGKRARACPVLSLEPLGISCGQEFTPKLPEEAEATCDEERSLHHRS
jgi:hypothetical protein